MNDLGIELFLILNLVPILCEDSKKKKIMELKRKSTTTGVLTPH